MSDRTIWQCPNCGGSAFADVDANRRRCEYCGTVFAYPEEPPRTISCPKCGADNPPEAMHCYRCGQPLSAPTWSWPAGKRADPAMVSIVVTVVGTMMLSFIGGALGLYLAYKALREAQESGQSEQLARIAVGIGWISVILSVLPMCLGFGVWGMGICSSTGGAIFDGL